MTTAMSRIWCPFRFSVFRDRCPRTRICYLPESRRNVMGWIGPVRWSTGHLGGIGGTSSVLGLLRESDYHGRPVDHVLLCGRRAARGRRADRRKYRPHREDLGWPEAGLGRYHGGRGGGVQP